MPKIKNIVTLAMPKKLPANLFERFQREALNKPIKFKNLPSYNNLKNYYFSNVAKTLAHLYVHLTKNRWVIITVFSNSFNSCCRLAFVIYELTHHKIKFLPFLRGKLDSRENLKGKLIFDLVLCADSHVEFRNLIKPFMVDSVMYK